MPFNPCIGTRWYGLHWNTSWVSLKQLAQGLKLTASLTLCFSQAEGGGRRKLLQARCAERRDSWSSCSAPGPASAGCPGSHCRQDTRYLLLTGQHGSEQPAYCYKHDIIAEKVTE